jgi:SRSO17 transposase
MGYKLDAGGQGRLGEFFSEVGKELGNKKRRESFAIYALGLLSSMDRKSTEPIAALATGDPGGCDACHQRLLHFLGDSPWDDQRVRRVAARYAIEAMQAHEPIRTWIIDDTGFLKQGTHSVGVQRQYTGSAGKIANCQLGVSLSVATRSAHVPIDFELYLPEIWTSDAKRREECKIPDEIVFKTKEDLALDMFTRAVDAGMPGDIVLADAWYGRSHEFRDTIRAFGFDYALGILPSQTMWRLDRRERRMGDAKSAKEIASELGRSAFRRVTWREGTMPGKRGKLSSRFALARVKPAHDDGTEPATREPVWLLVEWPDGEKAPTKFALTTLPRTMNKKQLVRLVKERWRTERVYEDMKGELGLDHFEGRSFPGWHHHVSVAICCYAFVVAERMRHFPPEAGRRGPDRSISLAA